MLLDIKTVVVCSVLTFLVCTFVATYLWRQSREHFPGIGNWSLYFAAHLLGTALIAARGRLPDIVSIVGANALIVGGTLLGYRGLARYYALPVRHVPQYILFAAFVLVHAYFTFAQPNLYARNINVSVALMIGFAQCAWLVSRAGPKACRRCTFVLRMALLGLCLVSAVRIVEQLVSPPRIQDFFQSSSADALVLVAFWALSVLLICGLTLMVSGRLHERVQQSDDKFTKLFRSSPAAVCLTRLTDGRIVEVNERFCKLSGFTPGELLNKTTVELSFWVDTEKRKTAIGSLSRGTPVHGWEEQFRTRSGDILTCLFAAEVFDFEGERYVLSSLNDITGIKLAETEKLHTHKLEAIGQLAAGIAHEINTPTQYVGDNLNYLSTAFVDVLPLLRTCQTMCAQAKAGALDSQVLHETERAIETADLDFFLAEAPRAAQQGLEGVARITKIVSAMKDFSHVGSVDKAPEDLNRAIESTLTVCRNEWKYVAQVQFDPAPDLPLVPCHVHEINQAVLNIVVNAAHAIAERRTAHNTPDLGTIRIATRVDEHFVAIDIQDDGTGMAEGVRRRIFEPFFTTKPVGKGTGQGLAIARDIVVKRHGGTIEMDTEPGKGTQFILRLPIQPAVPQGAAPDGARDVQTATE